jgi:hypothetical protein
MNGTGILFLRISVAIFILALTIAFLRESHRNLPAACEGVSYGVQSERNLQACFDHVAPMVETASGSGDQTALLESLLKHSPLEASSFLLPYLNGDEDGPTARQDALLQLGLQHNPRSRFVARERIDRATDGNDFAMIVNEISRLYRLNPSLDDEYLDVLRQIYLIPSGEEHVNRWLERGVEWDERFLRMIISQFNVRQIEKVRETLNLSQDRFTERQGRLITGMYLSRLLALGVVDAAYADWARWNDIPPSETFPPLTNYNPDLSDNQVTGPFDWVFLESQDLTYDRTESGDLEITFWGDHPTHVARQALYWPDGYDVQVSANYETKSRRTEGEFLLRLRCIEPNVASDIVTFNPAETRLEFTSKRDERCEVQYLEIYVRPGLYSRRISIIVPRIEAQFIPRAPVADEMVEAE